MTVKNGIENVLKTETVYTAGQRLQVERSGKELSCMPISALREESAE